MDNEVGFVNLIGPVWMKRQEGRLLFALIVDRQHLNRDGFLHGGMILAFFDHAIGIVAFEAGGVTRQVTIQLSTQFIKGARQGQFIEIHSDVLSQTANLLFMRAVCVSGSETLAAADGIWKKKRPA